MEERSTSLYNHTHTLPSRSNEKRSLATSESQIYSAGRKDYILNSQSIHARNGYGNGYETNSSTGPECMSVTKSVI
eukprot:4665210-Amphidinium_carterae.1